MLAVFNIPEAGIRAQAEQDGVTDFVTGIAIVRDDKVLVVRRVPDDSFGGCYELPGGGVDDGETFGESAVRECLEETGLTVTAITGMFEGFDYATKDKPKVRQLNFAVEVAPGDVVLEPTEHDDHRWIGPADIDALPTSIEMKQCLYGFFATRHN
jgi:8-oxo-dGTP diphosphatase